MYDSYRKKMLGNTQWLSGAHLSSALLYYIRVLPTVMLNGFSCDLDENGYKIFYSFRDEKSYFCFAKLAVKSELFNNW